MEGNSESDIRRCMRFLMKLCVMVSATPNSVRFTVDTLIDSITNRKHEDCNITLSAGEGYNRKTLKGSTHGLFLKTLHSSALIILLFTVDAIQCNVRNSSSFV